MTKKDKKFDDSELFNKMAVKSAGYLKDKQGDLLSLVHLKGEGHGFYWSTTDKRLIYVPRKAEYYLLPWAKDEIGRIFLFGPALYGTGVVLQVSEDEVDVVGFN
tara:strand:- start:375 stop:686 length:312 start_codon:yes stop_codon:yes gene_type:complete